MKLLELAASPLWASVTGGLFPLIGTVVGIFKAKQDYAFQLESRRIDKEIIQLQGNIDAAKLAGELAKLREQGAGEAFTASQQAETALGKSKGWVGAFREITRPALTWFYQALLVGLTVMILTGFAVQQIEDPLLQYIIISIVNTATFTVSWWFGQRQVDRMTIEWGNKTVNAAVKK